MFVLEIAVIFINHDAKLLYFSMYNKNNNLNINNNNVRMMLNTLF